MDIEVKENENLYRAVKRSNPDYIIGKNKVSSAMFKDESGVSVSRDGGRSEKEVISSFKDSPFWSKRLKAIGRTAIKVRAILPVAGVLRRGGRSCGGSGAGDL